MEEALYKGNSHDNGGIKVLVDGSKPIEVEGHEYLLCNKAMQSTKIFEFKNKTNKEILDEFHTYSTCEFKQNEAHSGDFIICKKVVLDTNKRNITGTIKEIVNIMQSEKGCRQSNDDVFKTGGDVGENVAIEEILEKAKPFQNELTQIWVKKINEEGKITLSDWDIEMYQFGLIVDLAKAVGNYIEKHDTIEDLKFQKSQGAIIISCKIIRNGKEHDFSTEVIVAGGYNVQKMHFRYIVSTKLAHQNSNAEYEKLNEQYKKMSKAQKLKEQISDAKNTIVKYQNSLNKAKENSELSDLEVEKLARLEDNRKDSWRLADMTWNDLPITAKGNYKNDKFYFEQKQKEYKQSLINFWRTVSANYKRYENNIIAENKQIAKLNKKLSELGISKMKTGGEIDKKEVENQGSLNLMKWYIDWYKNISDKMNITLSLPNLLAPFIEKNVVIMDLFEKINQDIDAKTYLQEIIRKADEYKVTIYLEPTPRYKYFLKNIEKRKKISKEYLIAYYEKFGFKLTPNAQFMKRKFNSNEINIFDETKYDDNGKVCYWKTYTFNDSSISIDYCLNNFFKIDAIGTKEKSRRGGDASKLIDYVKDIAVKNNFQKIDVYLPIDENTPRKEYSLEDYKKAVSFYKKNGFKFYQNSTVKMFCEVKADKLKTGGEIKPIRQLGTGDNVYFESEKYRVNDYKGNFTLNVGDKYTAMPLKSVIFDNVDEAVFIANELETDYPLGLTEPFNNVEKIIESYKKDYIESQNHKLEKMETKLQSKKEIDYSKLEPLTRQDIEFVETFKSADNNTKIIKFIWDGDFYEWKYSSTGSGGGIHIYKYNSLQALKKPLTTSGTHETIYNTWNRYQTTPEGSYIEYAIMKMNKDDIFGYGNNNLTTNSVSIKVEDYKNEFLLNKAIEKLIDYKGANRNDYNAEEINFISYYSGYGGLGKYGTVGRELAKGLKYEFYTPDDIVKKMWGLAYKYGYGTLGDNSIFETSAGIGNFLKYAPKDVKVVCNEINKYSVKILEILYPNATIYHKYFEQNFITKDNKSMKSKIDNLDKYSLIIGNPPYGTLTGKYIGMGEDAYTKAGNFCEYFITRSLDLLIKDGLLVYIVGAEQFDGGTLFLDSKMSKVKEIIFDKAHLIDAYRLPVKVFERTGVSSEILIFRKK